MVQSAYRCDFTADVNDEATMLKAFGCAIMCAIPESGMRDAIETLYDVYRFSWEDASIEPGGVTETIRTGITSEPVARPAHAE